MEEFPYKGDYVRYALYSAGFNPTDEIVNEIYATGYPRLAVDNLIASLRADPLAKPAMDFMEAMQTLISDAGRSQEQIGEISEGIRRLAE